MIRNLDPSAERFLLDVGRIQTAIADAGRQISSGLKVSTPSDAPDQISEILQLCAGLERSSQIRANLSRVQAETGTASETLATASKIVDRVRVLASQGAGTNQSPQTRNSIATEVQGLLEQLVSASGSIVDGRYVFSGDQDQALAYDLNLANPNGVNRLLITRATRQIQHPSGTTFIAAKTAQEIFDNRNPDDTLAADNVFAAVNGARAALAANDQPGIDAALEALRAAGDHLNGELSFYGTVQVKTDAAVDFASKLEVQLKRELSSLRDADLVEATLELERAKSHEAAAFASRAQMPRTSLFDYLG
jgi:flagellar hook-associated protein 3 FlgL